VSTNALPVSKVAFHIILASAVLLTVSSLPLLLRQYLARRRRERGERSID
jgi:hypothetical protein